MELTLSGLRSDYKLIYKVQPITAMRIAALIEFVKIEMEYNRPEFKAGKRIKIRALCLALDISLRTLYRWRSQYIKKGFLGLVRKTAPGRKARELSDYQKSLISEMRQKYRWGAEVIQAHLKHDHYLELSKYRIERYLTRSLLREKFPCTTKKRRLNKKKIHKKVLRFTIQVSTLKWIQNISLIFLKMEKNVTFLISSITPQIGHTKGPIPK